MTEIRNVQVAIDEIGKITKEKIVAKPSYEYTNPLQDLPRHLLFSIGDNGDYKTLDASTCCFGGFCRETCKLNIDGECQLYQTSNSTHPKSEKSDEKSSLEDADERMLDVKRVASLKHPLPLIQLQLEVI